VIVAPGNDGIGAAFECLALRETDPPAVVAAARRLDASLVVVGPEARMESSKWFAKEIMREAGVPTAAAEAFADTGAAEAALARFGPPWVVKADGLAAGKGVCVTPSRAEASAFLHACLEGDRFGDGGRRVVLEQHLVGAEASVIAVCDGERHLLLPAARDYKRALDGDRGANTGGMGGYAPSPVVTPELEAELSARVFTPVLRALAARGTVYRGALYAGLMLTESGPRVIEFNARFGDPEAQSVLPLLDGSLGALLASAAGGRLESAAIARAPRAAVTLALVDEGYPEAVRGGGELSGLAALSAGAAGGEGEPGALHVFHAGTRLERGAWVVRGGRAAYLTGVGNTLAAARARVYAARARLSGSGWRSRDDIAAQTVASLAASAAGGVDAPGADRARKARTGGA
jgi:phosphoribosylamine--glycine ligase